jgi:hypothetical protein
LKVRELSKYIFTFVLVALTLSCVGTSSGFTPEEVYFPLSKSDSISSTSKIRKLATTDSIVVFENLEKLQAIEINTHEDVWTVDDFQIDLDSEILFDGDVAVVKSRDKLLMVDAQGVKTFINLNNKRQGNIRLVAVAGNCIYIIRGSGWELEVYDISTNNMIWDVWTGRGTTQVFYEPVSNIAYVTNPQSVRAFDNYSGKLLWENEMSVNQSAYANGVLYLADTEMNSKKYSIAAIDVGSQKLVWKKEYPADSEVYIYGLSIFGDIMIMSTRYGNFAFDISNGDSKWQFTNGDIFYTKPVLFENYLYTNGASRKVYAISIENGNIQGYVRLESDSFWPTPSYDAKSGVYLLPNGIAFKTEENIVFYSPK